MTTLRTYLFLSLLFLANYSFAQWDIPDSYMGTATDINGNTHDFQSYLNSGTPVVILEITQWYPESYLYHEAGNVIDLYNQYGQGGTNDLVVLYVAGFGFDSIPDLSGIDYSGQLGAGYEDVSFVDGNPVPIILTSDNPGMQPSTESSSITLLCPEGEYWGAYGNSEVEEIMNSIYTNCCTNLETYDPALQTTSYNNYPVCDPTSIEYELLNETLFEITSCNIDVYINGAFEEQFEITETISGCSTLELNYLNPNILEGDEVTLAIGDSNDQLNNDTISVATQEVDTVGNHIKFEILNPLDFFFAPYASIGDQIISISEESNWWNQIFAEPGCQELNFGFYEDYLPQNEMLLIVEVDEFGNNADTLFLDSLSQIMFVGISKLLFVQGPITDQQTWGYVFEDINETQTFHPDLPRVQGVQVDHGNYTTFTDVDGYYNFENVEVGENTSISYDENVWPVFTTPNSGNYDQNNYVHNFGLNSDAPVWELSSNFNYGLPYICESGIHQTISVSNSGNQPATGEVTFTYDPMLTPVSYNPEPSSINGNTLTFEISEVQFGGFFNISIDYEELPADSLGQEVSADLEVITFDDQNNIVSTSIESVTDTLFCSYDPNDIYGFPLGSGPQGYVIPDTDLKYRIRFQNTGNLLATNVVVRDTLPVELTWESFEPGASSHEYAISMNEETREIVWIFNNIMLPDSATDPLGSMGYVWYDVEMNDLDEGDQILNTAYIYFDQNDAIITNTSLHTIDPSISIAESAFSEIQIYPNPANDKVTITGHFTEGDFIQIRDLQGRLIDERKVSTDKVQLNISDFSPGVYLVSIKGHQKSQKLIITN